MIFLSSILGSSEHLPVRHGPVDEAIIGELARRGVGQQSKSVRQLRYNSHICYVFDINVLFKDYRCPSFDIFFNRAPNLECHLNICIEWVKNVYPKKVYQLRETMFDKLVSFGIPYTDNQKLFSNMAIFIFESNCVADENFQKTKTITKIRKLIPISVSISSNYTRTHFPLQS